MAEMYEVIDKLLEEKNISGAKMSEDLGMSKSFMTELRKGRAKSIKIETAQKIADYFGVTTDCLIGREPMPENEKPTAQEGDRLSDLQREIMTIVQDAPEDLQKEFLNYLLFSKAQREK